MNTRQPIDRISESRASERAASFAGQLEGSRCCEAKATRPKPSLGPNTNSNQNNPNRASESKLQNTQTFNANANANAPLVSCRNELKSACKQQLAPRSQPKRNLGSRFYVLLALALIGFRQLISIEPRIRAHTHTRTDTETDTDTETASEPTTLIEFLLHKSARVLQQPRALILQADAQSYKPEWPSAQLQQEIFLLNLEDGYFGCQVNESQDFLQLFELSRLCDGQPQCYLGSDELAGKLRCNQRDRCSQWVNSRGQLEQLNCVNGVCLDGLCYCNDGFGGKSCDVPDENECKFRPCDVFAHCTNTMGSYYCSCYPGEFGFASGFDRK